MARRSIHPDLTVEYLLQELEQQGVDTAVIEAFAYRAAKRRKGNAATPRLSVPAVSSGESSAPDGVSQLDYVRQLQTA